MAGGVAHFFVFSVLSFSPVLGLVVGIFYEISRLLFVTATRSTGLLPVPAINEYFYRIVHNTLFCGLLFLFEKDQLNLMALFAIWTTTTLFLFSSEAEQSKWFVVHSHPQSKTPKLSKTLFDCCVTLILFVPVMFLNIWIATLILLFDRHQPLFRQQRMGQYQRSFWIYKFRTLDPKTGQPTPLGTLLRCSGLDELPQIFNILRGEMSWVGPRPETLEKAPSLFLCGKERFAVKPGVTGYWQLSPYRHLPIAEHVDLDVSYVRAWSLFADFSVLLMTPFFLFWQIVDLVFVDRGPSRPVSKFLAILILLAGPLVLFLIAKNSPALADDFSHILGNPLLRNPIDWSTWMGSSWQNGQVQWAYRPLFYFSFWLENHMTGLHHAQIRAINLAIHFLNTWLVLKIFTKTQAPFASPSISWALAALLLSHPVAWHNIIYMSARSTLLVSLFLLIALSFAIFQKTVRWPSLLFAGLSFGVKQTGVLAVPFLMLTQWHQSRVQTRAREYKFGRTGIFFLIVLFCLFSFLQSDSLIKYFRMLQDPDLIFYDYRIYLGTQLVVFMNSVVHLLIPIRWGFYFAIPLQTHFLNGEFFLSLFVFFLIWGSLIYFWKSKPLLFVGLALISIIPEMIYPRELISTEQRMYLPLLFLVIALGQWLSKQKNHPARPIFILIFLSGFFLTLSGSRAFLSRDTLSLLKRDIETHPRNIDAHMYLGAEYDRLQNRDQALYHWQEALRLMKPLLPFSSWLREVHGKALYSAHDVALRSGRKALASELQKDCALRKPQDEYCGLIKMANDLQDGRPKDVERDIEMIPNKKSAHYILLAKANLKLKNFSRAFAIANRLELARGKSIETYNIKINALLLDNKKVDALLMIDEAVAHFKEINPRTSELFLKEKKKFLIEDRPQKMK